MGFGQSNIPAVVGYVLGAAECVLFRESGRTAGDERRGLIKAEAAEQRILSREIVVDANVKGVFVEFPRWRVDKISDQRPGHIGQRIKINHLLCDRIYQAGRDYVARYARCLGSIGSNRKRIAGVIALEGIAERSAGMSAVRIVELRPAGEITISHGDRGYLPGKRYPLTSPGALIIEEEEGLVSLDGTPYGASKLVQVEFFLRGGEKALSVQHCVPKELKQGSVKVVRSRFCI